jgi:adenylate cyclase
MAQGGGAGLVSASTIAVSGDELNETDIRQRLAAILAADAAGYSRLMADDERATVAALDAARGVFSAEIESHQGRVIDMAGDSVLAVFPTATGALQAALAVQRTLAAQSATVSAERRMAFRVGVHLGDVMEKADGSIYGDGVNIAARLQGLAEPGGVTVSDAVQCALRQGIEASFQDIGEQQVKNIARPVRAYRVRIERAESQLAAGVPGWSGR